MTTKKTKICYDCRFCQDTSMTPLCGHNLALISVDIVTGAEMRKSTRDMRRDIKLCGESAELFEPIRPWYIELLICLGLKGAWIKQRIS